MYCLIKNKILFYYFDDQMTVYNDCTLFYFLDEQCKLNSSEKSEKCNAEYAYFCSVLIISSVMSAVSNFTSLVGSFPSKKTFFWFRSKKNIFYKIAS